MTTPLGHPVKTSKRRPDEGIHYPHVVKRGSISVTIYRFVNAARGEVFEVTWFQGGTRRRRAFRNERSALKQAGKTAKTLDVGRGDSLVLSGSDLESFHSAKGALAKLVDPPPMHSAMQEFVAAKKLLDNVPLLAAVQSYVNDKTAAKLKSIQTAELVQEFLAAKEADGLSKEADPVPGPRLLVGRPMRWR